jgi:hypothetical protein
MAEKRKVLEPVGTPSFDKSEAIKIVRQLREERLRRRREEKRRAKESGRKR